MLEFQEKIKLKKLLYSKITLFILIIVTIFLLNAVWDVYKKQGITKANLVKTATSLGALQVREKTLSSEIQRLNTESGKEEEVRDKYGLVRPGEEVIVIVDKSNDKDAVATSTSESFWGKIGNWFK